LISELATDETLSIEDSVVRVHSDLILGGISDKTFGIAVWREEEIELAVCEHSRSEQMETYVKAT